MNRKLIFAGLAAGAVAVSGFAAGTGGASAMPVHDKATTNAIQAARAAASPVRHTGRMYGVSPSACR